MLNVKNYRLTYLFICLSLVILHPYTIYGKPGLLVAFILAIYGVMHGIKKHFFYLFLVPGFILIGISLLGVISSIFNDIFQLNLLLTAVSYNVVLLLVYGLWIYCQRSGISTDEVIAAVMYVIVLNSVIIALELKIEPLRLFIEGFLDPIKSGSINYAEGFRFRGLAASGGAGLSVSVPVALTIAFYLYDRKVLPLLHLVPVVVILLFSVLVIGRTGLILSILPFLTYTILIFKRKRMLRPLALFFVLLPISIIAYQAAIEYFTFTFGAGFINYAIGFLLDGLEGIEKEGTASVILGFVTVLPLELPQVFTGYGFYGGSDFEPWTDSGYARIFLSVGFVFGVFFYAIIFRTYLLAYKSNEFLIGTLILLLAIAEIKEPFLFSGISFRIFLIVLVFCWFEKNSPFTASRFRRAYWIDVNDGSRARLYST